MARTKLTIINRSFWPVYPVIGEALLQFAENAAKENMISVIMQDHAGIKSRLAQEKRGQGISFYPAKAWTTSASGVAARVLDAVFFMLWVSAVLVWVRPSKVYVSTDPPVVVPFIVMLYCKASKARYVYHLQDIHPEAANVVIPVNKVLFRAFLWMDVTVMRNAERLITITEEMAEYIRLRSSACVPIDVMDNPAVSFEGGNQGKKKIAGFSFCGNAGRLQRIPLLLEAIRCYIDNGGALNFSFAGGGVYSSNLKDLAEEYSQVTYLGLVDAERAAQLNAGYEWALLPIEDEVTRYAFPSKSSSYVCSGAHILAVCGNETAVAKWVVGNRLGFAVEPTVDSLVTTFVEIENGSTGFLDIERSELKERLDFDFFVCRLNSAVLGEKK